LPFKGGGGVSECEGVTMTWCFDNSFRGKLRYYAGKAGVKTVSYKLLPTDATLAMMKRWEGY
jgi:hypothetical protein